MADSVFLVGREFRKSLARAIGSEHRIVTEATIAARRRDDGAFDHAFAGFEQFAGASERQHATKTRDVAALVRESAQLSQQSRNVILITCPGSGVARRKNSGRAAEHVDLE